MAMPGWLQIRCSDTLKKRLRAEADRQGIGLAELTRSALARICEEGERSCSKEVASVK